MSDTTTAETRKLSQTAKTLVDLGPLAVFFVVYFFGKRIAPLVSDLTGMGVAIEEGEELFAALLAYMPCFAIAFAYSFWRERRVAPMLMISFVMVALLGSLTLFFKDKTFFYMKPTIAYALFSATLAGGLVAGKVFLKTAFDGALQLPDDAWKTLTRRYAAFFAGLAIFHEILWRWLMRDCDYNAGAVCDGESIWVQAKLFGFTTINILFAAAQGPFLAQHLKETPDEQAVSPAYA
ncbi:MAG: inner membrane-spanning protein YciB, partial [Pseudomonadota bacterium]